MTDHSQPAPDWRPISSAPTGITVIGLRDPSYTSGESMFIGEVYDLVKNALVNKWSGRWAVCSHWLPLPPAPEQHHDRPSLHQAG